MWCILDYFFTVYNIYKIKKLCYEKISIKMDHTMFNFVNDKRACMNTHMHAAMFALMHSLLFD